ncbi:beta-lactam-binding protein with PASTA domain [Pontibacter ummariensis]|uniref:PASTA domain, binds beta-lactams n=1 Tax=Pontibacter ummariensis TaxID=1610492 RepID=A0A239EQC6_9BACT|nr:PASTA domain-containing protein [Pontibacter ummariensis]PRY12800.1 beta-lactam-binding protein with PASTA domain [Pontibacter ummariensis]SNS46847.1 PASTA domain, binds beta-lactams [Pontibacter ummariensis]
MFKANSFADVLKHLAIMAAIVAVLVVGFFYVYLPYTTNHGESIPVPRIEGMQLSDAEELLEDQNLRYFINDSTYKPDLEPFVILTQDPAPGAEVKEDRKIYISVNMKNPPMIKMPKLVDGSVKNAELILKSYDLKRGKITKIPDLQENAVLKQLVNGREVQPGEMIPKGSVVDLQVGDGLGNTEFEVPDVVGQPVDEASVALVGQGLQIGNIIYVQGSEEPDGTVLKQRPYPEVNAKIRVGEFVDLWVAGQEPIQGIE